MTIAEGEVTPMHVAFAGAMNSMCAEALNSRLMLIETISLTTTPEDMLELLARVIGNRTMGSLFFDNNSVMDYELMGGDARDAIVAETKKRGMPPSCHLWYHSALKDRQH